MRKLTGALPNYQQIGHSCQLLAVIVMGLLFGGDHMAMHSRTAFITPSYSDADRAELSTLIEDITSRDQ
jgi:hypothetical protein